MTCVRFSERSSAQIAFDIKDANGAAVPASALSSAQLTLFDMDTYSGKASSPSEGIINNRLNQDVLNASNVTIDSNGHVVWSVQADDNVIVTSRRQIERHRAMFQFVWASGSFFYEIAIEVKNLRAA